MMNLSRMPLMKSLLRSVLNSFDNSIYSSTVTRSGIESRCGWSPMEGHTYLWQVQQTLCNGHTVYKEGQVDAGYIGEPLRFRHAQ